MPTVEFEVWCSCGNGLCNQTKDVKGGIAVEPCEKCLDRVSEKANVEGYDEGYDRGYNDRDKEED